MDSSGSRSPGDPDISAKLLELSRAVIREMGCEPQGNLPCPGCGQLHAWCDHLGFLVCGACGNGWWVAPSS